MPPRCQIIAECATNHAGDMGLAEDMIISAAQHGADYVKFQAYQIKFLCVTDPQYAWLAQCELNRAQIAQLDTCCRAQGVKSLWTVFDAEQLHKLTDDGFLIKIGHGESGRLQGDFASTPWRNVIPLYPAPLETVAGVTWSSTFWSDHAEGLDVVKYFVARGAAHVEKHFSLPGKGRNQPWDMTPAMLKELRRWTEVVHTMRVGTPHSERWTRISTK